MNITITGIAELRETLASFSDRRFESALAEAINETGKAVRDEWGGQLHTRIDRPTALTKGAAVLRRADVGRLVAEVEIRDSIKGSDALPPSVYLEPHEFGGDRQTKKFERALVAKGSMPAGHKAVPGQYAQLDAFGNVSRRQIVQVLNQLGADLSVGYKRVISANQAKRDKSAARAGRTYVAIPRAVGTLEAGIYQRQGRALLPVFFFVARTIYGRRLQLQDHAARMVPKVLPVALQRAIDRRITSLLRRSGGGR
jgi:hypothetical protein